MTVRIVQCPAPPEHLVWRLEKDSRVAEARVRIYPHGRELRIVVNDVLFWSRLFRDHEDSRLLGSEASGCRQDFERRGWVRADGARTSSAT